MRVVELGCGLAVPSIVATLEGARVLATDWSAAALDLARANAERNGARLETMLARWDDPGPLLARGPFELVLGSDLLYERRNVELLLDLLPRLCGERGEILLADPGRPHLPAFVDGAVERFGVTTRRDRDLATRVILSLRPGLKGLAEGLRQVTLTPPQAS